MNFSENWAIQLKLLVKTLLTRAPYMSIYREDIISLLSIAIGEFYERYHTISNGKKFRYSFFNTKLAVT